MIPYIGLAVCTLILGWLIPWAAVVTRANIAEQEPKK